MLGTVLTMSQVLNCKTSTEAVSNETAEELNGSLLTEKPAVAAEVPYRITGFSSGGGVSQSKTNKIMKPSQPQDPVSQTASNRGNLSLSQAASGLPADDEHFDASASRFCRLPASNERKETRFLPPLLPFDYEVSRGVYAGPTVKGQPHGEGRCDWPDGAWYKGNWVQGQMEGLGKFVHHDKSYYRGDFIANKPDGKGCMKWPCGKSFRGQWQNGVQQGRGKLYMNGSNYTWVEYDKGILI